MKRIILIIALFSFIVNVNAQVSGKIASKTVQIKYTPKSPEGTVRLEISVPRDTVRVFYWIYREVDGVRTSTKRKTDCYVSWQPGEKYTSTYQKFNAWIRNKYNIE